MLLPAVYGIICLISWFRMRALLLLAFCFWMKFSIRMCFVHFLPKIIIHFMLFVRWQNIYVMKEQNRITSSQVCFLFPSTFQVPAVIYLIENTCHNDSLKSASFSLILLLLDVNLHNEKPCGKNTVCKKSNYTVNSFDNNSQGITSPQKY